MSAAIAAKWRSHITRRRSASTFGRLKNALRPAFKKTTPSKAKRETQLIWLLLQRSRDVVATMAGNVRVQ